MAAYFSAPWQTLPAEMKLSVIEQLDLKDVKAFASLSRESYEICIPSLWRSVELKSYESLLSYVRNVPQAYFAYTRHLSICTKSIHDNSPIKPHKADSQLLAELVIDLLAHCPQLEQLTLSIDGSLSKDVIPTFQNLTTLKVLSIGNCGDEQTFPLSERLVVSIAGSVPNLVHLSLDRIARSAIHAPELIGTCPSIPVVVGDDDIPVHSTLGAELSLPALLRLPTLKTLRIRDTHLGDPRWTESPVYCSLEVLDLGSCYHESQEFNRICTERIVNNVGHSIDDLSLNTAITGDSIEFAKPESPLKRLRKIQLTPLFPVENVVDTLTTLSGSPVEQLSVRCFEDDVADMCTALEDFLTTRVAQGETALHRHLKDIIVHPVQEFDDALISVRATASLKGEHAEAVKRLQEYLRDLRLAGSGQSTDTCTEVLKGEMGKHAAGPLVNAI